MPLLALFCCILLYPPVPKKSDAAWVGDTVVFKAAAALNVQSGDSGEVRRLGLTHITYKVVREDEDRVWVRQYDAEGWVSKRDALRVKEAEPYLTDLLKKTPDDVSAKNKRAVVRERTGDVAGALKDYDELIAQFPQNAVYHNNRSTVLIGVEDYDLAVAELAKAFAVQPNYPIGLKNRANSYVGLRRFEDAVRDVDTCLGQLPTYMAAVVIRGEAHCGLHRFDAALSDADSVLKSLPNDSDALTLRGQVFRAKGEYPRAIEELDQALRYEANSISAHVLRGRCWLSLGRPDKARYDFDEAVYANPKRPEARGERGAFFRDIGKYEEAQRDFEEALKLRAGHLPTSGEYSWMLATCCDEKFRDGKRALELAKSACERTEFRHGPYLRSLAAAYAELGDFVRALESLKKAEADRPFAEESDNLLKACREAFAKKLPYRSNP